MNSPNASAPHHVLTVHVRSCVNHVLRITRECLPYCVVMNVDFFSTRFQRLNVTKMREQYGVELKESHVTPGTREIKIDIEVDHCLLIKTLILRSSPKQLIAQLRVRGHLLGERRVEFGGPHIAEKGHRSRY